VRIATRPAIAAILVAGETRSEAELRRAMERLGMGPERRDNPAVPRVDAKALRAAVRRRDLPEIIRLADLNATLTEKHMSAMSGWFRGAGGGALAYQAAAAAVLHGADDARAREHTARILERYGAEVRRNFGTGLRSASHHRAVLSLAGASQAMYDEPEVKLYRGLYEPQGTELRRLVGSMGALRWNGVDANRHDPIDVELAPVSSWSESRERATMFAYGYGKGRKVRGSVVLRMTVPVSEIAFSWRLLRSGVAGRDEGAMALRDREVGVFSRGAAHLTLDDIDMLVGGGRGPDW